MGTRNGVIYGLGFDFSGTNAASGNTMTTNGQLLIGKTGDLPQIGTLASADGSITVTNGAGAIDLSASSLLKNMPIGTTINLGITYSSSTLSVTAAGGTALSASNPGYVVLASKGSPGQKKVFTVTANQGFIDDTGASEIIGNLFGLTTGVAVTTDIPFYIYAVSNDAETAVAFMTGRVPNLTTSPAVANIGAPDDPVADVQGSLFSFDNIDETLYDENPCACIGSFRMRMSAADDWTVQALGNADGIGNFNEETFFTVPRGHFGAASGKYFLDNGGTAPDDNAAVYKYRVNRNGSCFISLFCPSLTTAGVGAVTSRLAGPFGVSTLCGMSGRTNPNAGAVGLVDFVWLANDIACTNIYYVTSAAEGVMINTDFDIGQGINVHGFLEF